jgi:hypothetical protein
METILGLVELVVYVATILSFSMGITWLVIKISPSESAKQKHAAEGDG